MDQSYSESDVSLSPSKIFERLQMLRQLQIMQRGKLQKYRLQYQDSPEISSSVTEIVSHFSNSTSYNTFRSLLQSSQEKANDHDSCLDADISARKQINEDYIEGVSMLNLSQESEFIANSPVSTAHSKSGCPVTESSDCSAQNRSKNMPLVVKNQISLDEMPILSPKKNFEELIMEKLKTEMITKNKSPKTVQQGPLKAKKTFLRRGEGMARFGIKKNDLIIQNTKSLPWKTSETLAKPVKKNTEDKKLIVNSKKTNKELNVEILVTPSKKCSSIQVKETKKSQTINESNQEQRNNICSQIVNSSEGDNNKQSYKTRSSDNTKPSINTQASVKTTHPLKAAKGKTWASVLTTEQDTFLRQLKQSDYYKNFVSPAKSGTSDTSGSEALSKLQHDREIAEQNMFELLENKVTHESFNLDNSFIRRFLKRGQLDCSGESTPLVLQKCLYNNPDLLHLHPEGRIGKRNDNNSFIDTETCSDYTECGESCISVSTCCSCQKSCINESHSQNDNKNIEIKSVEMKEAISLKKNKKHLNDIVKNNEIVNADMAEMNAKLIATSELLKDRLRELEDEIETFRKENANMTKIREELDIERQKFYEEKTTFEQKYNEEKILAEYYLAEEKEKLNKQKLTYDRYIREMRGKLNKKDKEEVINLKKEVSELKEEIRNKDAKSTSTIARLRNQIKIIEKERKALQDEVEKLKKENRRIQHSNDITRRLTNLKYLEQINRKLAHMSSKDVHSEADLGSDIKYKAFEIERQSRSKKIQSEPTCIKRRRTKSVPNLNVTSRYAKYFSQKDSISDQDANKPSFRPIETNSLSDNEDGNFEKESENEDLNNSNIIIEDNSEDENNLEKIYNEEFQSGFPKNKTTNDQEKLLKVNARYAEQYNCHDGFFIQKSNTGQNSKSLTKNSLSPNNENSSGSSLNASKSTISILSQKSYRNSKSPVGVTKNIELDINSIKDNPYVNNRSRSPISILSNRSSASQQSAAIVNKDLYFDKRMIPSPEPSFSVTSLSKTDLHPTEIRRPDGVRELRFPNGNVKQISADGRYSKFVYYNGDVKENFYDEGRIKYFYAETKTCHTTHADGLEVLEFADGQVEKRYKDGSSEIRLPNGSVRYFDPKNEHVREEWRFPDGAALTISATGEQRIVFTNGQVEVHAKDHKRREFPDGTVKLVYNDGTSETRYGSGRVRIKDKHGNLIMDSAPG